MVHASLFPLCEKAKTLSWRTVLLCTFEYKEGYSMLIPVSNIEKVMNRKNKGIF